MRTRRFTHLGLVLALVGLGACRTGDDGPDLGPIGEPVAQAATSPAATASVAPPSTVVDTTGAPATAPPTSAPATTTTLGSTTTSPPPATTAVATTTTVEVTTTVPAAPATTIAAATPAAVPAVRAAAYAVFDMRSVQQLAESNADTPLPVGSLMKLLAAHVGYGVGQPTRMVVAPEGLVLYPGDESVAGIRAGQQLSRDTLIRLMLKVSANDAARMLAIDVAGTEAGYAALMNTGAERLALTNTKAVNVTGLDADGQYSSANDLVRLGVSMMGSITFQQTVKEDSATVDGRALPNTNDLLGVYPGADGIKTGHTSDAGWCILASATRDGRRIVAAVLGAPTEAARDQAATALLDYGFSQP